MRYLLTALLAWFPADFGRLWLVLVLGACVVVGLYGLYRGTLSIWPGAAVMAIAAAGGLAWEWHAAREADKTIQ